MLSFRVFAKLHSRRFLSPPPRDLCGRRLPRPCRGVGVHPEKTIRVGLVDRRTPAHSLTGRSLRPGLDVSSNASLSTFNRRSRPAPSISGTLSRLSTVNLLSTSPHVHKSFICNTYGIPAQVLQTKDLQES